MPLSKHNIQPVDPVLTQFMVDYINAEDSFIADRIFPVIPVANESGTYYTFTSSKDNFLLPTKTERAPGALYGRGQLSVSTGTYQTREDGWEFPVDRRLQENAIAPFDPYQNAIRKAGRIIALRREYNVISQITDTTTTFASYTAAVAADDRFDNADSDPIQYIDNIANTIRGNCGMAPNTMVMAWDVWIKVKNHPVILDVIKVTQDKIATPELLAKVFNVSKLYLYGAQYNSAQEGQTVSLTDLLTKKIFLGYVNSSPMIDEPSVGYTLQKEGFTADTYYEDQTRTDVARARVNEVHKIVAADCGYVLTTVIT